MNAETHKRSGPLHYRGRFAPTPSGPLHLGSLYTALASWLDARSQGGEWLLRIDDLDTPRNAPGAAALILRQLEAHGLFWDESPRYQSQHLAEYQAALADLRRQGLTYHCTCSRAVLASTQIAGPDGPVYAGTCRDRRHPSGALRLRLPASSLSFMDGALGRQSRSLLHEVGDFTLQRADGLISYQLACAVDEAAQGITDVLRGSDLLGSSFRQHHLQSLLGLSVPHYQHLPVLADADGQKLSKQNHATAIDSSSASTSLARCIEWLGMPLPSSAASTSVQELLNWALQHWPQRVRSGGMRLLLA